MMPHTHRPLRLKTVQLALLRRILPVFAVWLALQLTGCRVQEVLERNDDLLTALWSAGPQKPEDLTDQTWELLRFWELDAAYLKHPDRTLQRGKEIFHENGAAEWAFALAELSFLEAERQEAQLSHRTLLVGQRKRAQGKATQEQQAAAAYLDAVSYSYYFLFASEQPRSTFDRRNSMACAFYNTGLLRCLEWAGRSGKLHPQQGCEFLSWQGAQPCRLSRDGFCWGDDEFDELILAEALQWGGMNSKRGGLIRHRDEFGLGVPMVGVRHQQATDSAREKFLGARHPFAVTALFHPNLKSLTKHLPPHLNRQSNSPVQVGDLVLYDPLHHQSAYVAGQTVPLEMDLGAPLSFVLEETARPSVQLGGFLSPEKVTEYRRLYTFEAYQPGKIPVVCVHGLLSGPVTWTEPFRELWTDPEIRERYQFWFYLYPTGEPFLTSAAHLRGALQEMHDTFGREDRAYDHMVLVGHSMGGLMSKLQVTSSDDDLWKLVAKKDLAEIKTDDTTRNALQQTFFFEPLPFVEQVVFLGTPHHGSRVSRAPIGRLGSWLVRVPGRLRSTQQQLVRDNPGTFTPLMSRGVPTSIDLLATNNPVLETMNRLPYSDKVHLHSVVGVSPEAFGGSPLIAYLTGGANQEPGDSVVPVSSASLPAVDSEVTIPATHGMVHRHALAVQELRRVLSEHVATLQARYPIDPLVGPTPIAPPALKHPRRSKPPARYVEIPLDDEGFGESPYADPEATDPTFKIIPAVPEELSEESPPDADVSDLDNSEETTGRVRVDEM